MIWKGVGWEITVDEDLQGVTVSDECESIWFAVDELVPLILTLLKLVFENKWYGEAQDRMKL